VLLAGCTTTADEMDAPPLAEARGPLTAPGYMEMAASSDMFELESSRLAMQMSRNPAIRSFAQMMINDHGRTTNEMMSIGQGLRLGPPPPQMVPHHAEMLERLRTASPADFDRAYKREQVMAHQEALALHRDYADRGDAEPFRAFAARTVPVIEMHYGQAQGLPEYTAMPQPMQAPVRSGERG
jgi:putative membrane protein